MEHESHHHHHAPKTGVRWLDLGLGLSAGVVSLVSLWLGLHSAHSMEKLVAANSYPYLELMRSNISTVRMPDSDRMRQTVTYFFENNGIGPARIEWVQFNFKGKPMRDMNDLIEACCSMAGSDLRAIDTRGNVVNALVRPGTSVPMFTWNEPSTPNPAFYALLKQMNDITFSACYCSVFDECYVRSDDDRKPQPVEQCTPPAVTFRPGFHPKGA
ncbi:hypothetical protein [Massilia litorea]|uniref:Uncharacterized protein n=1 Tax=Massilia litorea TaxID=2769491 RepID=A0A7L9U1F0_9BURK|nr:hypothetical protein [Massilia litorea]QOL48737.1 hypothetical protein LPB04_17500 [Massilia litorea]